MEETSKYKVFLKTDGWRIWWLYYWIGPIDWKYSGWEHLFGPGYVEQVQDFDSEIN